MVTSGVAAMALALSYAGSVPAALGLPKDWRLPTETEASDQQRNDMPGRYARVVADFNGDGIDDEALLLKSQRFSGEALWVKLSVRNNDPQWVQLARIDWGRDYPNVDLAMGVKVIPPGTYSYICVDGSRACDKGLDHQGRPKITTDRPGILYFKFESAASMFIWDPSRQKFRRLWVSD
jgi:hypothetical protein